MKYTQVMEDYMWTNHFAPLYAKIGSGRQRETILELQFLIQEMSAAGYAAFAIGKYLDKDHTTILHHLKQIGKKTPPHGLSAEKRQEMQDAITARAQERLIKTQEQTRAMEERIKIKQAIAVERLRKMKIRSDMKAETMKRAAKLRPKIFELYKKGLSYRQIAMKLEIPEGKIQSLLTEIPEYHAIKTTRQSRNPAARKPVEQYDFDGNLIATYPSGRHAGRAIGTPSVAISLCCNNKIQTAGGYQWKFKDTQIPA